MFNHLIRYQNMKKNNTGKRLSKHTKAKRNAAPAKSAENIAQQRTTAIHIKRLSERGLSKEKIDEMLHDPDARLVLCIAYDSYVLKREGQKNLHGIKAIKFTLNENKIDMIDGGHNYVYILTKVDDIDNISEAIGNMGRISIRKWEDKVEKPKKEKKPTNNTAEKKQSAKNKRKTANKKAAEMRPYYAALRKGGVSERIKKHNKELAEKIQKWLDEKKEMTPKNKSARKVEKKAKLKARREATIKRVQSLEKKRMDNNIAKQKKAAQKAGKQAQIEFKEAA